jgi:hypothetical protein
MTTVDPARLATALRRLADLIEQEQHRTPWMNGRPVSLYGAAQPLMRATFGTLVFWDQRAGRYELASDRPDGALEAARALRDEVRAALGTAPGVVQFQPAEIRAVADRLENAVPPLRASAA